MENHVGAEGGAPPSFKLYKTVFAHKFVGARRRATLWARATLLTNNFSELGSRVRVRDYYVIRRRGPALSRHPRHSYRKGMV